MSKLEGSPSEVRPHLLSLSSLAPSPSAIPRSPHLTSRSAPSHLNDVYRLMSFCLRFSATCFPILGRRPCACETGSQNGGSLGRRQRGVKARGVIGQRDQTHWFGTCRSPRRGCSRTLICACRARKVDRITSQSASSWSRPTGGLPLRMPFLFL